jgi:hypothetical protein
MKKYKIMFNITLIILTGVFTWLYTAGWRDTSYANSLNAEVYGLIGKPFVYRQLLPLMTRFVIFITGLDASLIITGLIFLCALGFVYSFRYLQNYFFKDSISKDVVWALSIELLFIILMFNSHQYDMATVFLVTLCLGLMIKHQTLNWYYFVFLLACINRETMFILIAFYAIWFYSRLNRKDYLIGLICQICAYLIIKISMAVIFADNAGVLMAFRPLENLFMYIQFPILTILSVLVTSLIGYLIIRKWNDKPDFFKISFLVFAPILIGLYFLAGVTFEYRVFIEIYPVIVLMTLPYLVKSKRGI